MALSPGPKASDPCDQAPVHLTCSNWVSVLLSSSDTQAQSWSLPRYSRPAAKVLSPKLPPQGLASLWKGIRLTLVQTHPETPQHQLARNSGQEAPLTKTVAPLSGCW
ncbi:hypothetical protein TREES_T100010804 [Tupaia chinensis]|uniref:Uncharacterized protein n=1 Tax=Tupaia chinensis TaxID=246437 RepID=L9KI12_TUPCH|nr:hypothetical protein TREES_T100010804 [Tupaia chinensis]